MQHAVRTMSSSEAKASLGEVLSSLAAHGPIEITRNGRPVGLLTAPAAPMADLSRIMVLATAYSKGLVTWAQIADETGASYGDLLVALGLSQQKIPKVRPRNRPEQVATFHAILDAAAARAKEAE